MRGVEGTRLISSKGSYGGRLIGCACVCGCGVSVIQACVGERGRDTYPKVWEGWCSELTSPIRFFPTTTRVWDADTTRADREVWKDTAIRPRTHYLSRTSS